MRFNKESRDKALMHLLSLKENYHDHCDMNKAVKNEVLSNVSYHGPDCPLVTSDAVDRTLSDMEEMNRDLRILFRSLDRVSEYLLGGPGNKKLDKEINNHLKIRDSFAPKWDKTIKKRSGLCDLMVAMNTPENEIDDV